MFSFQAATWEREPFPHAVVRGAWDETVLFRCKCALGETKWSGEKVDAGTTQNKRWCNRWSDLPMLAWPVIACAHSGDFVAWLEQLTGIVGLLPDPHLRGGGVHRIGRGGFLKMHTDFNYHEHLRLYRRLNLLLYLNPDWRDEWGGRLSMTGPSGAKVVRPDLNTMVIFETSDRSWHGHPEPMTCPEGMHRDSIALYYYTAEPPAGFAEKRVTTNYDA